MTAVIGILNKHGVALAADSAVTISDGNGRKIYNTAYKIFTLSKYHPVSIMIYNSATFMGIPWETLIKEYRKQLKDKSFDKLVEYQSDFIIFLKESIGLVSTDHQNFTASLFIEFVLEKLIKDLTKANIDEIEKIKSIKGKKEFIKEKLEEQIDSYVEIHKTEPILTDFNDYKLLVFIKKYSKELTNSINKFYSELKLSNSTKSKLYKVIHHIISSEYFFGGWTGLVFSGFGDKEIYPSCLPIKIGEVIDNRIRYVIDEDSSAIINDGNNAAIRPFAQRDVIDTILSGIDSKLESSIYDSFDYFLKNFLSLITDKVENDNIELANKIQSIDVKDLVKSYSKEFQNLKRKIHISPLMSSIASLSKEDLSELAESLIYLTYLKRRMSFSEESVGGPIDVAIVTKGDGFIWIKRKHYFSNELNQDFIYKYLNS